MQRSSQGSVHGSVHGSVDGSVDGAVHGALDPATDGAIGPATGHEAGTADHDDTWIGVVDGPLPLERAAAWVVRPDCGAVVTFSGTARDHSPGRPDVTLLEYEAYDQEVTPRLSAIAAEARRRWPDLGRLVLVHRTGPVAIGESSVVVAASAPHRTEAFEAARFCIDTLKATVPIWKREHWAGGSDWALGCHHVTDVTDAAALHGGSS